MDDQKSPFERIPQEIRDKIYELVFLDPVLPALEGENKSIKYKNYLGLLRASKQINREVEATLQEMKPIFVISCNVLGFGEEMIQHGIPILSDYRAGTVNYQAVRLHVRFPRTRHTPKTVQSYVILLEHLSNTCLLLRGRSLDPATYVSQSSFMHRRIIRVSVQLKTDGDRPLSESEQIKIMEQMIMLKYAGAINVHESTPDAVLSIIEPFEHLGLRLNNTNRQVPDVNQFLEESKKRVFEDGKDSITFLTWRNATAAKAYLAKDYALASCLYEQTLEFVANIPIQYQHFVHPSNDPIFPRLDDCNLDAEIGFLECSIELGHWTLALSNYKTLTSCITEIPERTPQGHLDRAVKVEKRLRSKFGEKVVPYKLFKGT